MEWPTTESRLFYLPHEVLVEHILVHLNREDINSCLLVCRQFRDIISDSVLLSYLRRLDEQGLLNNPSIPYAKTPLYVRQEMLSEWKTTWQSLNPSKREFIDIPAPQENGVVFDIAKAQEDGIYLRVRNKSQSDFNAKALKYFTWQCGQSRWEVIEFDGHHLVDFALAVNDYDLVACLTNTLTHRDIPLTFHVRFFHHSTSAPFNGLEIPHPVLVVESDVLPPFSRCKTGISIYGKRLAVRIDYEVRIFNWKTGALVCRKDVDWETDLVFFLSEDLICIPLRNSEKGHALLIYQVLGDAESGGCQLSPALRLNLPEIRNPSLYDRISVFGTHPQLVPPKPPSSACPFFTNPDLALLVVDIVFHDRDHATILSSFTSVVISFPSLLAYIQEKILENCNNEALENIPWKIWSLGRARLLPHAWYRDPPEISMGDRYLPFASCHGMVYALDRGEGTIEILDFGRSSIWARTASQCPSPSDEDWVSESTDSENESEGLNGDDEGLNGDDEGPDDQPSLEDSQDPTESWGSVGPDDFEDLEETYIPDGSRPFTEPITTTLPFISQTFREVYELEEWSFFVVGQTSIVGYMDLSGRSQALAGRLEILYFG